MMHFPKEAAALLALMRAKYSDDDCWSLGYEDDDGAVGYFMEEYRLRMILKRYVKLFDETLLQASA